MGNVAVKRSYKAGHVGLKVSLKSDGWRSDSIKVDGSADLSTDEARDLAAALIEAADREDEKAAKKAASEVRRRKWREREIAAGRMVMISPQDFLK